jgi:hypothetical protein
MDAQKKEFPAGRALILRIALDTSKTNVDEYSKNCLSYQGPVQ